jgi:hypothetical protein
MMAYRAAGIDLPRTTYQQVYAGTPVYSLSQLQPGDLPFTPGADGTPEHPGHVGMFPRLRRPFSRQRPPRPRPSCGPVRMMVRRGTNTERYKDSPACPGSRAVPRSRGTGMTRCAGTNTSSMTMQFDAEDFIPATNQVSSMSRAARGISATPSPRGTAAAPLPVSPRGRRCLSSRLSLTW